MNNEQPEPIMNPKTQTSNVSNPIIQSAPIPPQSPQPIQSTQIPQTMIIATSPIGPLYKSMMFAFNPLNWNTSKYVYFGLTNDKQLIQYSYKSKSEITRYPLSSVVFDPDVKVNAITDRLILQLNGESWHFFADPAYNHLNFSQMAASAETAVDLKSFFTKVQFEKSQE